MINFLQRNHNSKQSSKIISEKEIAELRITSRNSTKSLFNLTKKKLFLTFMTIISKKTILL